MADAQIVAPYFGAEETNPQYDDIDSGFGGSIARTANDSTMVGGSVYPYVYEHGRRYQVYREGVYVLPNDSQEIERLDLFHYVFIALLDGKLYIAPLGQNGHNVRRVLDIGTGTGAWAVEIAEEFPDAEVIGNDLSRIQESCPPKNCTFEIDDIESPWLYPKNHFDFIHARSLSGCFEDWDTVIRRCFEHTAPGGYFEFQDYDCKLKSASGSPPTGAIIRYWEIVSSAAASTGRPFEIAETMRARISAAGFVDVTQRTEMWPLGTWPESPKMKEVGRWTSISVRSGFHAFGNVLLTRVLGWGQEQIRKLCEEALEEVAEGRGQLYGTAYYICGRKPSLTTS